MSNFWQRTLTGILFVAFLVGATLFSAWSFSVLLLAITVLGLVEYCQIFEGKEYKPNTISVAIVGTIVLTIGVISSAVFAEFSLQQRHVHYLLMPVFILPLVFTLFIIELYRKKPAPFQRAAVGAAGIFYVPISLSYFLGVAYIGNNGEYNAYVPLSCFILIWSSDTFAYLAGRSFGKHKLFLSVSPKKTWEGFIGGIIGTIGISILLHYTFGIFSIPIWIGLAVVIAIFGLWGDLIQSMLKRSLNVKDSGTILPGHGGILDRFDSLLFAVPFVAVYLYFVV